MKHQASRWTLLTFAVAMFIGALLSPGVLAADPRRGARPRPRERERESLDRKERKEREERDNDRRARDHEIEQLRRRVENLQEFGPELGELLRECPKLKGESHRIVEFLERSQDNRSRGELDRILRELSPHPVQLSHLRGVLREASEIMHLRSEMRAERTYASVEWNNHSSSTVLHTSQGPVKWKDRIPDIIAIKHDGERVLIEVKASEVTLYNREIAMLKEGRSLEQMADYVVTGRASRVFDELVRDFTHARDARQTHIWRVDNIDPAVDRYVRENRLPVFVERFH